MKNSEAKIFWIGRPFVSLQPFKRLRKKVAPQFYLDSDARQKMERSRHALEEKMKSGESVYGVNTGFGYLSSVKIKARNFSLLQKNLLLSHAVGTGKSLSVFSSRLIWVLRAQSLTQGYSGVRPGVVEKILEFLNVGLSPVVPEQGSVGASGDLSPLAHAHLPLIGEGFLRYENKTYPAAEILKKLKLVPIELTAKEGLALINGTQMMNALGIEAVLAAQKIYKQSLWISAMSVEALRGSLVPFDKRIHQVRPHRGQQETAKKMRNYLFHRQKPSAIAQSHAACTKVQDPYSLRCIPQVHGACLEVIWFATRILLAEANAVTDNPLIFGEGPSTEVLSGGNFHGQILAFALDALSLAVAELGSISERRIDKMMNPAFSGLNAFLAEDPGLESGMMIVQVAAAALVSENKTYCVPASTDSIPTSLDKEDHVSMGPWAARKAMKCILNVRRIYAMEALCGAQAIRGLRPLQSTPQIEKKLEPILKVIGNGDRFLSGEIAQLMGILNRLSC